MTLLTEAITDSSTKLAHRVHASLRAHGHTRLHAIECHAEGGRITLRGSTSTYYLKQVAQTIAARVPGVRNVHNEVTVATDNSRPVL